MFVYGSESLKMTDDMLFSKIYLEISTILVKVAVNVLKGWISYFGSKLFHVSSKM